MQERKVDCLISVVNSKVAIWLSKKESVIISIAVLYLVIVWMFPLVIIVIVFSLLVEVSGSIPGKKKYGNKHFLNCSSA